ncbi:MAG: hypothetical protein JWQ43_443 [Glaciihabitans sp.]|nr:hypothetical protein [Glaciihabitans sp.]
MDWRILILIAMAILLVVLMALEASPRYRRRAAWQFSRLVDLPLTERIVDPLGRRLARRTVFSGAAGLLSLLVYGLLSRLVPDLFALSVASQVLLALFVAVFSLGLATAAFDQFARVRSHDARVARLAAPRLSDYLAPGWLVTAVACTVAGLVAVAIIVPATVSSGSTAPYSSGTNMAFTISLAVVSLVVFAATVLISRRLIGTPQPAANSLELAWDDAMRARALRDLWSAPLALGLATLLAALTFGGGSNVSFLTGFFFPFLMFSTIVTPLGRRFQKRLWPETVLRASDRPPLEPELEEMLHGSRPPGKPSAATVTNVNPEDTLR